MTTTTAQENPWKYPDARRDDSVVDTYPGDVKVHDPYRWLEDPDSAETKAFVDGQNVISSKYIGSFKNTTELRGAIEDVYNFEKFSAPTKARNGFYYWSYNPALLNQAQIWRSKQMNRTDAELFFDPNLLSDDGTVALGTASWSEDGTLFAYSISKSGSDNQTIFVKDSSNTDTLQKFSDEVVYVKFSGISWTNDNKGFVYHRYPEKDNTGRGTAADINSYLCYHKVGDRQDQDLVLHKDPANPTHMFGGEISDDGKYLIITTSQGTEHTNKLSIVKLGDDLAIRSDMEKISIVDDFHASWNYITNYGSTMVFETNENAPNNKLVTLDMDNVQAGFKELVAESKDVLNSVSPFNHSKLILTYTHDVKDQVSIYDGKTGTFEDKLALPVGLTVNRITCKHDTTDGFFISVGGFTTPNTIYRYEAASKALTIYRETDVPGIDPQDFETEQVFYTSKDGTKVPMFITGRKGLPRDGSTPCLQYGYGGFQISVTPTFSPLFIVLMKHFNARVAVANIRGGGEYGQSWWKAAIREKRQNAFDDFQWASKFLVAEGYTQPAKLAIYGGSNGGLLVAVCLEQAPQQYGAVMAAVGVLDMLRFHKFTIGAAWISDYGSPDDPAMFPHLRRYSPLHNVDQPPVSSSSSSAGGGGGGGGGADDRTAGGERPRYPATLLLTADHDDRVVPANTLKFTAELQFRKPDNAAPLIVRVETNAGHGGGKPTSKKIDETRDQIAFWSLALGAEFEA